MGSGRGCSPSFCSIHRSSADPSFRALMIDPLESLEVAFSDRRLSLMKKFPGSSIRPFAKNHQSVLFSATCILAVLILACGGGTESGDIVARSDIGSISRADLETFILTLDEDRRRPSDGQTLQEWRTEVAKDLMVAQAMRQRAETLDDDQNVTERIMETRNSVLAAIAEQRLIDDQVVLTENDLRKYYDQHPGEFSHAEQIRLRHIFRRVDRDAGNEQWLHSQREMEDLLKSLREGAHFGDLARRLSDSETAHLEGLIGRLDRGALPPPVEEIVWNLETGEISDVVKTPVGFHIFRLEDHLSPFHMEYDEARTRIHRKLEKPTRDRIKTEALTRLISESGATFEPDRLLNLEESLPGDVLFSLNDTVVTIEDYGNFLRTAPFLRQHELSAEEWLLDLVWPRLLLWHADHTDLESDPSAASEIEAAVNRVKIRIGVEDHIKQSIESISDEGTLEEFFRNNENRFKTPKMYRIRLIVADFGQPETHYRVFEQLDRLAKEIRNGTRDMAEAARSISDDPTASNGGLTGWVFLDSIGAWAGPRVQKRLASMKIGEISEPLLVENYDQARLTFSRQGYLLVKLEALKMPEVPSFETVKDDVIQKYIDKHRTEMEAQIRADVLDSIGATIIQGKS